MINTPDEQNAPNTTNSLDGEEFATRLDRRRLVQDQPRDSFGRWVAEGANVRWRSEGQDWAGVVQKIEGGKALVEVKNANGTEELRTLKPETLRVFTSKATLKDRSDEVFDAANDFKSKLNSPAFMSNLEEDGTALIKREDGYMLDVSLESDVSGREEKDGNPIMFQLFAPNGKSLGRYTEDALNNLDAMVEDHKNGSGKPIADGTEIVASASNTAKAVRITRDSKSLLMQGTDGLFSIVSLETGEALSDKTKTMVPLLKGKSWRKIAKSESESLVASIPVPTNDFITEVAVDEPKPYRVPPAVKEEIISALSIAENLSETDTEIAKALAYNESVSLSEVQWIDNFFSANEIPQKLRGGYKGQKWASKITSPSEEEDTSKYSLDESKFDFYAIGSNEGSVEVHDILAVDFSDGSVFTWSDSGFTKSENVHADDIEEPMIVPVDQFTAEQIVKWKDSNSELGTFNLEDVIPEERNLFELAAAEMDFEELDRLNSLVADATGYTPQERSANAQRQPRGPGGKFGGAPVPQTKNLTSGGYAKARIDENLPIETDPAGRIAEWLATAPITAAVEAEPVEESETPAPTGEAQGNSAIYFAIVDEVDKTAVLDAVAITKNQQQLAEAWVRKNSAWEDSPDTLAVLQGATPPPVVELEVPEPVKTVLAQVDEHDAANPEPEAAVTATAYSDEQRKKDAKKGFAMPSGAYPIHNEQDLKNAIKAFGRAKESEKDEVKRHIRKRAKALNRMDLIPENWRELSAVERGYELANQSPLYGEYGQLIAAGVPGVADTPSDFKNVRRLKNYWKYGAGAAKIRWGSKGDLTRCHRHLSKYMPGRAWGYCQNIHMEKFGKSNYKRDNG